MHVAFISNLYPPLFLGGYELLCADVVEALERRGHRCSVLTSRHGLEARGGAVPGDGERVDRRLELYAPFERPAGLERHRRWWTGLRNARTSRRWFAEVRPDLVFVWSQLRLTLASAWAARDLGLPVVFTFNDDHVVGYRADPEGETLRERIRAFLSRHVLRRSTLWRFPIEWATCISACLKRRIEEQGIDLTRAEVIHQGIPLERFPCKEALGRPPGREFRVLYVGQLHPYKGVLQAIEAMIALLEAGRRVRFDLVGRGDPVFEARLARRIDESGKAGAIRLLGPRRREELSPAYREADVLVFPSVWEEPFGLTHLEAMASGTAVVATDHGGPAEFLRHEDNALTVPPDDVPALARAVARSMDDEALRLRIARAGRELVVARYGIERYVGDLEGLLVRALASSGRGAP